MKNSEEEKGGENQANQSAARRYGSRISRERVWRRVMWRASCARICRVSEQAHRETNVNSGSMVGAHILRRAARSVGCRARNMWRARVCWRQRVSIAAAAHQTSRRAA
jgi:hypothetical protein